MQLNFLVDELEVLTFMIVCLSILTKEIIGTNLYDSVCEYLYKRN